MEYQHVPVLLKECIRELQVKEDGFYVDGTVGGGGHSFAIAQLLGERGRLLCLDQDGDAVAAARERLRSFPINRVTIRRSNFSKLGEILDEWDVREVSGILLDLGVSSYQLDNPERGFSYRVDAPLDMRMDDRNPLTAQTVVNTYSLEELSRVIRDYGEDRFAQNIAKHIVAARQKEPILTTLQLVRIIDAAIPAKVRAGGGHPAKRTFQALRIEVNQELQVLRESLKDMIERLCEGGRLCVITFHSLEDRLVKDCFREMEHPCICPPDFPVCVCGRISKGTVITRKPITPSPEELEENPRSASAKLRVFERRSPRTAKEQEDK